MKYKQAKGEQLNRSYPADVWDRNKIYSIVHNRVYTGDLVYRRQVRVKVGDKKKVRQPEEKWTVIPNHHEAIVSRELFKKVNENIRQGKAAEYDRLAVKKGIIFCGYCGNRLELHRTKKTYYLCKRKDMVEDIGCKELRIEQDTIFQAVWKGWQAHFSLFQETSVRELLVKQVEKLQKQANVLSERAERFPVKKLQLYERFRSGEIDQEVFRQEKEVLDQQEGVLSEQIETLSTQIDVLEQKQKGYQDVFSHAAKFKDMEEKIIVYDEEQVEVVWRYQDKFERIINSQ